MGVPGSPLPSRRRNDSPLGYQSPPPLMLYVYIISSYALHLILYPEIPNPYLDVRETLHGRSRRHRHLVLGLHCVDMRKI